MGEATDSVRVWQTDGEVRYAPRGRGSTGQEADGAAALQEAVNALPQSGGAVTIGTGVYDISETVELDRPVVFSGVSAGNSTDVSGMTILKATADLEGALLEVTGENAADGYMHGTRISDLAVVGHPNGKGTDCVHVSGSADVQLSHMYFQRLLLDSAPRHGFHIERANRHHHVDQLWSGHCGGDAIAIRDGFRYWVSACYGYDSRTGIRIGGDAADVTLSVPHCRQNRSAGIRLGSDRCQLHGGRTVNNDGDGVVVLGSNSFVTGHEALNNGAAGFRVGAEEHATAGVRLVGNCTGNVETPPFATDYSLIDGIRRAVDITAGDGIVSAASAIASRTQSDTKDEQHTGIDISPGATNCKLASNQFLSLESNLRDDGERTIVNGCGVIEGSPIDDNEWSSIAQEGVVVWDVVNDESYRYVRGEWRGRT